MKTKVILMISLLCFYMMPLPVFSQGTENEIKEIIARLESLDVVRNAKEKWDGNSGISRKEALMMAYLPTNMWYYVYFPNRRFYNVFCYSEKFDFQRELAALSEDMEIDLSFCDLQEEDQKLVYTLLMAELFVGREINGRLYAGLDSSITNEEALIILIRMLDTRYPSPVGPPSPWSPQSSEEVYKKAIEFNLIAGNQTQLEQIGENKLVCISQDQLSNSISAYTFLRMYDQALTVEVSFGDSWSMPWTGTYFKILDIEANERSTEVIKDEDILV